MSTHENERPSARRRAARWTANLLLVAVTLSCAAWLLPSLLGMQRYVITGGSMSGTFEKGSLAFEKEVPASQLREGDVITYLPPPDAGTTDLVTHRIVRIKQDEKSRTVYRTKGDANDAVDPWTFRLQQPTQPVVQFTVPYAGYALMALADRETRMLAVGGPAALVALLALGELVMALVRREGDRTGVDGSTDGGAVHVPAQRDGRGADVPATAVPAGHA